MFHRLIERQARRTFAAVNARDYDQVLASARPDMSHRFGGDHALGGERHDLAAAQPDDVDAAVRV